MPDEVTTATVETTSTETTSAATESTSTTPTETSAPATETTTTTTETTEPEWKAPAREPGEDSRTYLNRARAEKEQWIANGKKAPEVKTEEAKPAEHKEVEAKPEETKVEPAKEEAKTEEKPDEFEELEGLATSELAAKLKADPALDQALTASGLKNQMFANARLADMANEFRNEFPGGIGDAKFAKEQATIYADMDDAFSSVVDVESANAFVQKAVAQSYVLGEDGKPLLDANGHPRQDGTVGRFVANMVAYGAAVNPKGVVTTLLGSDKGKETLLQEIQSLGDDQDEELTTALEILKERINRGPSTASTETSAEARKIAEERQMLEAERTALDQRRETERQQTVEQQDRALATDISNRTNEVLDSFLGRYTWMSDFEKSAAREEIRKEVFARIQADPFFSAQAAALARKQYSKAAHDERAGLSIRAFKSFLPIAAKPVIEKAGAKLIKQQESKAQKITTQVQQSKAEPKGGMTTPGAKPVLSNEELGKQARDNVYKAGGDPSDSRLVLAEMRRLKAASGQ